MERGRSINRFYLFSSDITVFDVLWFLMSLNVLWCFTYLYFTFRIFTPLYASTNCEYICLCWQKSESLYLSGVHKVKLKRSIVSSYCYFFFQFMLNMPMIFILGDYDVASIEKKAMPSFFFVCVLFWCVSIEHFTNVDYSREFTDSGMRPQSSFWMIFILSFYFQCLSDWFAFMIKLI